MNASTLVQKLWNYCNILRDDGLSTSSKASLDLFWLRDESLSDSDNLPAGRHRGRDHRRPSGRP